MAKFHELIGKFRSTEAIISFIVFLVIAFLCIRGSFDGLEVKTLDFRFRQRRVDRIEDKVVVIYITDECIERIGPWPWPRSLHAKMVDSLKAAGAEIIIFDVIFRDAIGENSMEDRQFVEACAKAKSVVFPLLIDQFKVIDPNSLELSTQIEVSRPFDAMASVAAGLGFINVDYQTLNPDGIIRKLPLFMQDSNQTLPALDLAVAEIALGKKFHLDSGNVYLAENKIPMQEIIRTNSSARDSGSMFKSSYLVNYLGETTSGVFQTAYYSDVASGIIDPAICRDKIVLIGPSAAGLADIKLTPYGEMPGVLIHANVIQNLLKNNFLVLPGSALRLLSLAFLSLLTFFILMTTGFAWGGFLVLLLIFIYDFTTVVLFIRGSIVIEMVAPSLLIGIQALGGWIFQLVQKLQSAYQSLKERSIELENSNQLLDLQVRDLSRLNDASRCFGSTLNMELLAKQILDKFQILCAAGCGILALVEPETDALQTIAQYGFDENQSRALLYDPQVAKCLGRVLEERVIVPDRGGRWFTRYIPLLIGPKLLGVVFLKENDPNLSDGSRDDFWSTLSGLAATALENARLYNLATVDTLTRLYVRSFFQFQIEQEFKRARRYTHRLAFLITDIDHFKSFNDNYGHQQGDIVLREVASAVKKSLREIDIAARYGGEEFGIILPETDLDGAIIVAERIRRNVEQLMVTRMMGQGDPLRVTLSVGVASFPDNEVVSSDELIRISDTALYKAKETGRNRVEAAPLTPKRPL